MRVSEFGKKAVVILTAAMGLSVAGCGESEPVNTETVTAEPVAEEYQLIWKQGNREDFRNVLGYIAERNLNVRSAAWAESSLEDLFLEATRGETEVDA